MAIQKEANQGRESGDANWAAVATKRGCAEIVSAGAQVGSNLGRAGRLGLWCFRLTT